MAFEGLYAQFNCLLQLKQDFNVRFFDKYAILTIYDEHNLYKDKENVSVSEYVYHQDVHELAHTCWVMNRSTGKIEGEVKRYDPRSG